MMDVRDRRGSKVPPRSHYGRRAEVGGQGGGCAVSDTVCAHTQGGCDGGARVVARDRWVGSARLKVGSGRWCTRGRRRDGDDGRRGSG